LSETGWHTCHRPTSRNQHGHGHRRTKKEDDIIVHLVEDVSVFGVIASDIEVIEKGFGCVVGSNVICQKGFTPL
jgi:hypothetical protein